MPWLDPLRSSLGSQHPTARASVCVHVCAEKTCAGRHAASAPRFARSQHDNRSKRTTDHPRFVMKRVYDALVVGGGHNGLVTAAYLARAGKTVCVLESRHVVGGAAVTEELVPGYKFSRGAYLGGLLRPGVIRELGLETKHGLRFYPRVHSSFTPLHSGESLLMGQSEELNFREIAKFSAKDAEAYPRYEAQLKRFAHILENTLDAIPPDPASMHKTKPEELLEHMKTLGAGGRNVAKLGGEVGSFLQFLTAPASQWLDMWFESEPLKATLATDAVIGAHVAASTPGTGYVLLHHVMGEWAYVEGGMGSISNSIAMAAQEFGADIQTGAQVDSIDVCPSHGNVRGVTLSSGEKIPAKAVISNATPHATLMGDGSLLRKKDRISFLPKAYANSMSSINYQSSTTKINVAVNRIPQFTCTGKSGNFPGPEHEGTIHVGCESMDSLHTAYRDAEYNQVSSAVPLVEMTIPSVLDPTLAPEGHHVVNLFVQYTPYTPADGPWDAVSKQRFAQRVFALIDSYAPGFSDSIVGVPDILTPPDLERTFGLTGGNIFHGEMTLDRLFITRPASSGATYRVPGLPGLYLCGAGTHPGGGVMGAAGRNCSRAVLRDI